MFFDERQLRSGASEAADPAFAARASLKALDDLARRVTSAGTSVARARPMHTPGSRSCLLK